MFFGNVGASENVHMHRSDGWLECEHTDHWTYPGTLGRGSVKCMQFATFVVSWVGMSGQLSQRLCRAHARQELRDIASGKARDKAVRMAREFRQFERENRAFGSF